MIATETELLQYLDEHSIEYHRIEHPAVYTCEQAEPFRLSLPATSTKNLFLRDEKQAHFYLAFTACVKRLDLKAMGKNLGVSKLHFGSETQLLDALGVTPGAVTVLGLVNDVQGRVELLVDTEIWDEPFFLCHPLVNTSTLVITRHDLLRFFDLTGHTPRIIEIPGRQ